MTGLLTVRWGHIGSSVQTWARLTALRMTTSASRRVPSLDNSGAGGRTSCGPAGPSGGGSTGVSGPASWPRSAPAVLWAERVQGPGTSLAGFPNHGPNLVRMPDNGLDSLFAAFPERGPAHGRIRQADAVGTIPLNGPDQVGPGLIAGLVHDEDGLPAVLLRDRQRALAALAFDARQAAGHGLRTLDSGIALFEQELRQFASRLAGCGHRAGLGRGSKGKQERQGRGCQPNAFCAAKKGITVSGIRIKSPDWSIARSVSTPNSVFFPGWVWKC